VGLAIYGANRAAAGFSATSKHRALTGAGVDRFARKVKTWLEDFF
jgi:cell division protein FtsA